MTDRYLTAAAALLAAHPGRRWPCCEWVARIVRAALDLPHADGSAWWRAMNVWDPRQPWSPIESVLGLAPDDLGPVFPGAGDLAPGRWYVCQGWRRLSAGRADTVGPGDTGHTWLWYATSPTHGVVLDSSTARGPRFGGVAFTGQALPEGRPWAERIAAYPAGVAVALLPE